MTESGKSLSLWQGRETNRLMHASIRKEDFKEDIFQAEASKYVCRPGDDFAVFAGAPFTFTTFDRKACDYLVSLFTKENRYKRKNEPPVCSVCVSISDMANTFGISTNADARYTFKNKVKKTLDLLSSFRVEVGTSFCGKLFNEYGKGGNPCEISVVFSKEHADYLMHHRQELVLPEQLFRGSRYDKHGYFVLRKLLAYNRINNGKRNCISLKNVILACPLLPSREHIIQNGYHAERDILSPIKHSLSHLSESGLLRSWSISENGQLTYALAEQTIASIYRPKERDNRPRDGVRSLS